MSAVRRISESITRPPAWAFVLALPLLVPLAAAVVDHDTVLSLMVMVVALAPLPAAAAVAFLVMTYLSDPKRPRSWFLGSVATSAVASFAGSLLLSWVAWTWLLPDWEPLSGTDVLLVLAEGIVLTSVGPILLAAAVLSRLSGREER